MTSFKEFTLSKNIKPHPIEKMREYSHKEFPWEYREYTNYAHHYFPKAFKSEEHFKDEYNKSPIRHLTHNEIHNLDYSTASGYLNNSPVKEKIKKAHNEFSHRRNLNRIDNELHNGKMAPPIVLKHSKGMRILGGNTRLSFGLANNKNIPVKIIDISERH